MAKCFGLPFCFRAGGCRRAFEVAVLNIRDRAVISLKQRQQIDWRPTLAGRGHDLEPFGSRLPTGDRHRGNASFAPFPARTSRPLRSRNSPRPGDPRLASRSDAGGFLDCPHFTNLATCLGESQFQFRDLAAQRGLPILFPCARRAADRVNRRRRRKTTQATCRAQARTSPSTQGQMDGAGRVRRLDVHAHLAREALQSRHEGRTLGCRDKGPGVEAPVRRS